MKASKIVSDARGEADLVNAEFITHDDETASLNAAYKDLYAEITKNDDDYFLSESTVTITAGMKSSGTDNEYLLPLPADFWKLRYVDYAVNSRWERMERFSLNLKNDQTAEPMYRFRDQKLWVIMGTIPGAGGQIKIGYYPNPEALTVPETALEFAATEAYATRGLISSPFYTPLNRTMLYVYGATSLIIKAESKDTGATTTLYTGATAITNLVYYKGYIYFILGGNIWRGTTTLTATVVPAAITAVANILNFAIYKDLIYFNDGTNLKTCALAGTGTATLSVGVAAVDICFLGSSIVYLTSGNLKIIGTSTILATAVSHVASDGDYLYIVASNALRRLTVELVGFTVTEDLTLREDVSFIGNANDFASIQTRESQQLLAASTLPDTDLSYPLNALFECMVMQLAVDFKRKQNQDGGLQAARLTGLWKTLQHQLKRDEYKVERIRNHYDRGRW